MVLLENRRKSRNDLLLIRGSWAAAIGAIGLFLMEIWKVCMAAPNYPKAIEISTFFFVFFFGIGAGMIIYQIIRHLLEKME